MVEVIIKIESETTDPRRGQIRSHYKRINGALPEYIGTSTDTFVHEQKVDLIAGTHSVIYTIAPETYDWLTKIYVDGVLLKTGTTPIMAEFEVGIPPPPEYTLTITATGGGTTDPPPGSYAHSVGEKVTVSAIPLPNIRGWFFNHWTLNGAKRRENPITVTMDRDLTLHAVFSETPPLRNAYGLLGAIAFVGAVMGTAYVDETRRKR